MRSATAEIGSTANSYQILAKLAVGGMAEIFLARSASLGTMGACKCGDRSQGGSLRTGPLYASADSEGTTLAMPGNHTQYSGSVYRAYCRVF